MKKIKFKTIAITSTSKAKYSLDIAKQCCEVLINKGIKVLMTKELSGLDLIKGVNLVNDATVKSKADLLISIGGDGTMLSCARKFGSHKIPILGINLGNLGFLTDIAPSDMTLSILEVLDGKFKVDRRIFLGASLNDKKEKYLALNEIVIHSGALAQMIEFELYIDNVFVYRQKADGIIVSSPTGSTAYSLSGGGPIIHPSVEAITLLPMFPHSLNTSPLVVNDNSNIIIKMTGTRGKAKLNMDSHDSLSLKKGDQVKISKNDTDLLLIHPLDHNFYSGCRNKLGWSSSIS